MHPRLHTRICDLFGIDVPIVQTGMGWVAGPRLVSATAEAGGLGILASATMDFRQLQNALAEVKTRTQRPFGVNLRADAVDINDRVKLLINEGVKVASFAQAPREDLIEALHNGGVLVMPSIGAKRHAEKVARLGRRRRARAGRRRRRPHRLGAHQPPVAAGGRRGERRDPGDRRGWLLRRPRPRRRARRTAPTASPWAPASSSPPTPRCPEAVKQFYLGKAVTETVVTTQVDGVPHRVLHTDLINELESTHGRDLDVPACAPQRVDFRRMTGIPLRDMAREGLAMRKSMGLTWTQTLMAANTPMLLKAALVDGKVESGVMASGQVVGVIDDLPTCQELIDRIVAQADDVLGRSREKGLNVAAVVLRGVEEVRAAVGRHFGYSDWLEITQERVNLFAEATGDYQWIHVDVERATRESPYGGPIAHGYLSLSLSNMLVPTVIGFDGFSMAINYGVDRVRFPSAVPVGARLRAGVELAEVSDVSGGIQTLMRITMEVEGSEKPACVIDSLARWLL